MLIYVRTGRISFMIEIKIEKLTGNVAGNSLNLFV